MPVVRAEELSYKAVRHLDKEKAVCFLPVSALEVHGPHLPLGMDFYMARWMAEDAGRRFAEEHPDWTVIQYPPLPLGTDELPLRGSMNTNQRTVYTGVRNHGESLARAGFRYIVVTNGHGGPRHAAALEAACRKVSRTMGVSMFSPSIAVLHAAVTGQHFDVVEDHLGRSLTDAERNGLLNGEHAGTWETSFMLAENPDLVEDGYQHLEMNEPPAFQPAAWLGQAVVDYQKMRGRDTKTTEEKVSSFAGGIGWLLNTQYGYGGPAVSYHGVPAVASREIGEAFREILGGECHKILEEVVSGRTSATAVRSIASSSVIVAPGFFAKLGAATAAVVALLVLL